MIILGIDPGLATMGYGVVEHLKGNSAVVDYGVRQDRGGRDCAHREIPSRQCRH